jgi:4-amino-4-deoxy-L-arabinose transferase-like glycosyltransferase
LSEFSLRIPEMLGVGVAALSVYWFARRHTSPVTAAAGAIFLLCTYAYQFAYEARPYDLVVAFSGLALVAWQRATEESRARGGALAGVALMITAAIHNALSCET